MATIGKKIKVLRERCGESQLDIGKIVGVSDKAVSSWENDKKLPRMKYVQRLAGHFNVPVSSLVEESVSMEDVLNSKDAINLSAKHASVSPYIDSVSSMIAKSKSTSDVLRLIISAIDKISKESIQDNAIDKQAEEHIRLYLSLSKEDRATVDKITRSLASEARDAAQDSASSTEERNKYA